ncbi:MAG: hypothetical protein A2X49_09020 [Lentisphaerae bacterium GWF2_52_8]|nr:MAG: hypothetical protein A2X49_09020 [Lentisphaerae bacterium GWF2_52_8]
MPQTSISSKIINKPHSLGFVSANKQQYSELFRDALSKNIKSAAQRRGCAVSAVHENTLDPYAHSLDNLLEGSVCGLIWHGATRAAIPPTALVDRRLPIVLVQPSEPGLLASVHVAPGPGIAEAVEHLAHLGHREILWLGLERNGRVRHPRRREAFWRASSSFEVSGREWFVAGNWPEETQFVDVRISRYRALLGEQLLLPPFTTAVICEDDALSVALVQTLSERKIRVPEEVSVIGVDDLQAGGGMPNLSSVDHMLRELGSRAVDMALRLSSGSPNGLLREVIPSRLVVRESTWRCRWTTEK